MLDPLPFKRGSGIEPRTSLEIDMLSLNLLDPYSPQGGCTLGTNSVRPSMQ